MKVTNNSGLQAALDWLEANGENEENFIVGESESQAAFSTCLMCKECKKKFPSLERAESHAVQTSHDDFVEAQIKNDSEYESVPLEPVPILSEEQKAARLAELRAKLALKRESREKEVKEAEVLRKASSKELEQVRREMQTKEMKRLAEDRRLEKLADKKRREEIKKQIEEDRANKKRQIESEKAKLAGRIEAETVQIAINPVIPVNPVSSSSSARIQIKLPPPNLPLKLTFESPSTQTLKDLKTRIKSEYPLSTSSMELMQTFPTRIFGKDDDNCTLNELGLSPSASLILK